MVGFTWMLEFKCGNFHHTLTTIQSKDSCTDPAKVKKTSPAPVPGVFRSKLRLIGRTFMTKMRVWVGLILAFQMQLWGAALPPEYDQLKKQAEQEYASGSFARAHEAYEKADKIDLPSAEKRWVTFRLADTQWRAQAQTQTSD